MLSFFRVFSSLYVYLAIFDYFFMTLWKVPYLRNPIFSCDRIICCLHFLVLSPHVPPFPGPLTTFPFPPTPCTTLPCTAHRPARIPMGLSFVFVYCDMYMCLLGGGGGGGGYVY